MKLLLFLAAVIAFEDTSPFFFLSSAHSDHQHPQQLALSTASFRAGALAALSCDVPTTIVAIQPSIHASDFDTLSAPLTKQYVASAASKLVVPYAHGDLDVEELVTHISETCHAEVDRIDASTGSHPIYSDANQRVAVLSLPTLPLSKDERKLQLEDNDAFLHSFIDSLTGDWNLIYTSTPPPASPASYRRAHVAVSQTSRNSTGGLFSHYQFFTPGIFMGYMALLILVPVLILGLSAISALQVTYRSFEK